ncbi:hypothetical protein AYJ54_00860 [Bradyrhizobium centrolobii]|uniref:Uncharacterized protein n=1 Tax=Bradyrhizobium centrolobii TaxID=1505087 RepID=A0A176YI30_9BRAD|nr:hypothetical protein [Bradyrhizobium centrolobii]OAF05489.1 hypothetical protein AYJ54_00860 [Bradyrhizobium centrolobii]
MAGSFKHCLTDEGNYHGLGLLENMKDMAEAVEQMAFMLLQLKQRWGGEMIVQGLEDNYYECLRGERPWPDFMKPGIED